MAYFIIVDAAGELHGAISALSAQYVTKNLDDGQSLVEVDAFIENPEQYTFKWDTRELTRKSINTASYYE